MIRLDNYSLPWYPGHDKKYGKEANCMVNMELTIVQTHVNP